LDYFQYYLKGVSFLPMKSTQEEQAYAQMPYEEIDESKYITLMQGIKPIDWSIVRDKVDIEPDRFCDSSVCNLN
jgi:hypothetical protein